jgi:type II secretory pathway component GspD/PulD (secretin)
MALEPSRLLAATLAAAVLGTSCSTPPDSDAGTPTGDPSMGAATAVGNAPAGGAQDPQGGGIDEERRRVLVANYLRVAQALRANNDLLAAKVELLKAKDLSPANEEVRSLLASVQAELGEPAGLVTTIHEEAQRTRVISEERARTTVRTQLQKAQQAVDARNYDGAIEELRLAALTIELKDDFDWQDLPAQVKTAREDAERRRDEQLRQSSAEENARQAERLRRDYAEQEAQKRAQVDALILEAQVAFEARQFQRSQDFARRAMELEPQNSVAFEMHNAAVKASRDNASDEYIRSRALANRKMMEADEALKVPNTATLELDAETWERAQRRNQSKLAPEVMSPENQAVWNQVRDTQVGRITYTEETGDFLEVFKNLTLMSGLQIIATPEARAAISGDNLKLVIEVISPMSLRDLLNHMIGRSDKLGWTVKNGAVLVGTKAETAGSMVTESYPVGDLLFPVFDHSAPRLRDIPSDATDDAPRTGAPAEEAKVPEEGALVEVIKSATGGAKEWDGETAPTIQPFNSQLLIIKATPQMHARIQGVLRDLRRFKTPIVTIDSKFLTISRNFLQEIGIDFRGLGGSGNKGSVVSLDDVTNGLVNNSSRGLDNGGTGDPAANPLAGAFFNDGGDGDVRARSENYFTSDLGRVLTPSGGLTAGWTLLDDVQLNMILRAVEKRQDGEVVNSQVLSIVDTAKGNVAVINQTAYVRDFDVEVAQAAFIADPKVDVIQDGLVLEVRPTILNDRKYLLLELNPTVAELQRPIPTFTTSLAGSTLPVTIQLPNLTVTNFATTARVPDGGTVLLGGLRQVLTKERRAEIPLLSRLPLISFLFKQEGSVDENRSLMVMVRAQITDVVNK